MMMLMMVMVSGGLALKRTFENMIEGEKSGNNDGKRRIKDNESTDSESERTK